MARPDDDKFHLFAEEVGAAAGNVEELLRLNAAYFSSTLPPDWVAAIVWLVNTNLTMSGVAPAWRGLPLYVTNDAPKIIGGVGEVPRQWVLGPRSRQQGMLRWIDLQWLRAVLGPGHQDHVRVRSWTNFCSDEDTLAEAAWSKINHIRLEPRGSTVVVTSPFRVMFGLNIPPEIRIGLTALCDKSTAKRREVAYRRVSSEIKTRVQQHMERPSRPLASSDGKHRVTLATAIELAQGNLTLAAKVFGWMTGRTITRQSVHELRDKMREQYGLKRMYWRP